MKSRRGRGGGGGEEGEEELEGWWGQRGIGGVAIANNDLCTHG